MEINKEYNERIDETLYYQKHESGLEIYFLPKEDFMRKHAFFVTKYGSIYNRFFTQEGKIIEKPAGIAHFLEHKIFEESEGNTFEKFALLGANVNANTKFDSTTYNFSTVDHFYENLELLLNFVQTPHINDMNVEKEKGIIEEEIKMYLDNPDWMVYFNLLRAMYQNNPVNQDIAGTVESIKKITKEDLLECYNYFYSPENMIVFITGNLDYKKVFKTVDENLKEDFIKRDYNPEIIIEEINEALTYKEIKETMDVSQNLFAIGFKGDNKSDTTTLFKEALATRILMNMMFGESSEFYNDLYSEGLIDENFANEHTFNKHYVYTVISGSSDNPKEIYKRIFKEINRLKEEGLEKGQFIRVKRKFIGRFISSFNSLQSIASAFVSYKIKDINIFNYLEALEAIDLDYIQGILNNHFIEDNAALSIIQKEGKNA